MPAFLEKKLKREYPGNPGAVYGTLGSGDWAGMMAHFRHMLRVPPAFAAIRRARATSIRRTLRIGLRPSAFRQFAHNGGNLGFSHYTIMPQLSTIGYMGSPEAARAWRARNKDKIREANRLRWLAHKAAHPEIGTRDNPGRDTRFKPGHKKAPNAGRLFVPGHTINKGRTKKVTPERTPKQHSEMICGWAAGLFEGEGSVSMRSVVISQKDTWCLHLLRMHFGGTVGPPRADGVSQWWVCGQGARDFVKCILPMLSPRRQRQFTEIFVTDEKLAARREAYKQLLRERFAGQLTARKRDAAGRLISCPSS